MTTENKKQDKRVTILTTEEQQTKLKLMSFYSGKSIGEIIRQAIDNFNPEDFKKEDQS